MGTGMSKPGGEFGGTIYKSRLPYHHHKDNIQQKLQAAINNDLHI